MANTATTNDRIGIEVAWGRAAQAVLEGEDAAGVVQEIATYAQGLAADLGLPVGVAVRSTAEPDDTGLYRLRINGEPARIPVESQRPSTGEELARRVATAVLLNRELLLDDGLIRTLRRSRTPAMTAMHLPGLSNGGYLDLHRILVRACQSVVHGSTLSEQTQIAESRSMSPAAYAETALEGVGRLRVAVRHAPSRLGLLCPADGKPLGELLALMQDGLFYELGVRIPRPALEADDRVVRPGEVVFQVNGVRLPPVRELADTEFLVNDTPERLKVLDVEGRAALNPATGAASAIVKNEGSALERCRSAADLTTWGRDGYLVLALSKALRRHAAAFVTRETVTYDLDLLAAAYPVLVDLARNRFALDTITQVIRQLAREEISFRDLRGVLEGMLSVRRVVDVDFGKYIVFLPYTMAAAAATFGTDLDLVTATGYTECVRASFKRYISHKYTRGQATLIVYLIDTAIEQRIAGTRVSALNHTDRAAIVKAVAGEYGILPETAAKAVLLTTLEVRHHLRNLIEIEFPDLPVVSYQELSPDMNIQPIARITLEEE